MLSYIHSPSCSYTNIVSCIRSSSRMENSMLKLRGLSGCLLIMLCASFSAVAAVQRAVKNNPLAISIGVVYEEESLIGKMGSRCIQLALSDFYKSHAHYKTRIVLHDKLHPKDSAVGAAAAALYLIKYEQVKAIVGPTTSMEAEFVIQLGERARVPIISYSATSPFLSPIHSPYFIRAAQVDSLQARPIRDLVQAFGWREAVPIYAEDSFGAGLMSYLSDALEQVGVSIPYRWPLPISATDDQIREGLYKLHTMQTRVFIVHTSPELGSRLFLRVNELSMMNEGYVWVTTTAISNELGSLGDSVLESMQGVLGVKTYVPRTRELRDFSRRWDREFQDTKPSVMALWAYDTASALARAVERAGAPNFDVRNKKAKRGKKLLTDLDTLGVSPVGPKLLEAMHNTSFRGLAGDFGLADGQLRSSTYQIVNVMGSSGGAREVGFWTPERGLARDLNPSRKGASSSKLRAVIWPGEAAKTPKGWDVPTGGRRLRVGVPVNLAYEELVKVTLNGSSPDEYTAATGFCIDVFDAVMSNLPFSVLYKYVALARPDGSPAGSYDDLVDNVYRKEFDVAVGDITIIPNRSNYVDFTLPYTESGVTMVVPVRSEKPKSAWVFLKPLTWDLWVASFCAFTFMAFVIWLLEHRINDEFRGPPSHQAGTSLFYSFSLMVFAQKENVLSNLARFVVITWVFVVLILTQSYTASLTSMLTVQQLKPSVSDANELVRTGARVSYQEGTFVRELLISMGFHESKLVPYDTREGLDELLTKGCANGGVAAVFDELPYMRLFLAKYSSKYTMVQPTYKTGGFGFAFPKGSPLVPDVSSAILRVTEGDDMKRIERAWGMSQDSSPPDGRSTVTSNSLSLQSFWGLFLIAVVASGLAVFIFAVSFLVEHRDIWRCPGTSMWGKLRALAASYDRPNIESHTFRKTKAHRTKGVKSNSEGNDVEGESDDVVQITPRAESPPRPSSYYSDQTEESFAVTPTATTAAAEVVVDAQGGDHLPCA